jgi:hypothetical protein
MTRRGAQVIDWLDRHGARVACAAAALVFVAGAAVSLALPASLRYWDEREYLDLAQVLCDSGRFSHDGTTPSVFRPPGYPALLSLMLALGAPLGALRAANYALLAGTILVVHALARRVAGGAAAAVAAVVLALYPASLYTAAFLYPQTLAGLLLAGAIALVARREPPRAAHGAAAGALLGALILSVPIFAASAAMLAACVAWSHRRRAARCLLPMIAATVVLVGAWSLRNRAAVGAPVFVAANGGLNLLLGNNENARPDAGVDVDIERYRREARGLGPVEEDALYRRRAVEWIQGHEGAAAWLYARKVAHYFAVREPQSTGGAGGLAATAVMLLSYGPLLLSLAVRVLSLRRDPAGPTELPLLVVYLGNALVMAVFFTRIRFRVPLDALLVAAAVPFALRRLPAPALR